jgi:hypothetical protein
LITVFLTDRWKVKSNCSSVLRCGKRAVRIRPYPPCASRAGSSATIVRCRAKFRWCRHANSPCPTRPRGPRVGRLGPRDGRPTGRAAWADARSAGAASRPRRRRKLG